MRDALEKAGHGSVETAVDGERHRRSWRPGSSTSSSPISTCRAWTDWSSCAEFEQSLADADPGSDRPAGGARKGPAPRRRSRRLRHETLRCAELVARARALLRRSREPTGRDPTLAVGRHRGGPGRSNGPASEAARTPDADRILTIERPAVETGSGLDSQAASLSRLGIGRGRLERHASGTHGEPPPQARRPTRTVPAGFAPSRGSATVCPRRNEAKTAGVSPGRSFPWLRGRISAARRATLPTAVGLPSVVGSTAGLRPAFGRTSASLDAPRRNGRPAFGARATLLQAQRSRERLPAAAPAALGV